MSLQIGDSRYLICLSGVRPTAPAYQHEDPWGEGAPPLRKLLYNNNLQLFMLFCLFLLTNSLPVLYYL